MTERRLPQTAVENLVEDLASKANADLSNLDATGQAKFDAKANISLTNSPYTTKRILEIPQDIKLELNNGTLTLKAGSKAYKSDGTAVNITSDKIIHQGTVGAGTGIYFAFVTPALGVLTVIGNNVFSGDTAPDKYDIMLWFDTANKDVKFTQNKGETWVGGYSLPICTYVRTNGVAASIDKIFNGFGCVGSHTFALSGVKVQTPNGRNEDGTYKTVIRTIDSVRIFDAGALGTRNLKLIFSGSPTNTYFEAQAVERFTYNKKFSSDTTTYSYDENTGWWWYSPDQSSWVKSSINIVGSCRVESGRITSFEPYTVDSVANSNLSNLSAAGQAKFDAKANVDLNNLSTAGQAILNGKADINANNFTETGKQNIVGWGMPDYSAGITGTLPFTAPKSGKISVNLSSVGNNDTLLYINGALVGYTRNANGGGVVCMPQFDVSGGDVVTATGGYQAYSYYFYPCKGV